MSRVKVKTCPKPRTFTLKSNYTKIFFLKVKHHISSSCHTHFVSVSHYSIAFCLLTHTPALQWNSLYYSLNPSWKFHSTHKTEKPKFACFARFVTNLIDIQMWHETHKSQRVNHTDWECFVFDDYDDDDAQFRFVFDANVSNRVLEGFVCV